MHGEYRPIYCSNMQLSAPNPAGLCDLQERVRQALTNANDAQPTLPGEVTALFRIPQRGDKDILKVTTRWTCPTPQSHLFFRSFHWGLEVMSDALLAPAGHRQVLRRDKQGVCLHECPRQSPVSDQPGPRARHACKCTSRPLHLSLAQTFSRASLRNDAWLCRATLVLLTSLRRERSA